MAYPTPSVPTTPRQGFWRYYGQGLLSRWLPRLGLPRSGHHAPLTITPCGQHHWHLQAAQRTLQLDQQQQTLLIQCPPGVRLTFGKEPGQQSRYRLRTVTIWGLRLPLLGPLRKPTVLTYQSFHVAGRQCFALWLNHPANRLHVHGWWAL